LIDVAFITFVENLTAIEDFEKVFSSSRAVFQASNINPSLRIAEI